MSDAVSTDGDAGGWSKSRLRTALLASVAVNLLCVGLIAGALFAGPPRRGHTEYGMLGFARTLPPERGDILREAVRSHRPEIRELKQGARGARLEATSALEAEAYDKEKIRASLVRIDQAEGKLRTLVTDIFIDAVEKLTPEERRQLAEWWKKRQPKLFWRHGGDSEGEKADPASQK